MPRIDKATFLPTVFWTFIIYVGGFLFLSYYTELQLFANPACLCLAIPACPRRSNNAYAEGSFRRYLHNKSGQKVPFTVLSILEDLFARCTYYRQQVTLFIRKYETILVNTTSPLSAPLFLFSATLIGLVFVSPKLYQYPAAVRLVILAALALFVLSAVITLLPYVRPNWKLGQLLAGNYADSRPLVNRISIAMLLRLWSLSYLVIFLAIISPNNILLTLIRIVAWALNRLTRSPRVTSRGWTTIQEHLESLETGTILEITNYKLFLSYSTVASNFQVILLFGLCAWICRRLLRVLGGNTTPALSKGGLTLLFLVVVSFVCQLQLRDVELTFTPESSASLFLITSPHGRKVFLLHGSHPFHSSPVNLGGDKKAPLTLLQRFTGSGQKPGTTLSCTGHPSIVSAQQSPAAHKIRRRMRQNSETGEWETYQVLPQHKNLGPVSIESLPIHPTGQPWGGQPHKLDVNQVLRQHGLPELPADRADSFLQDLGLPRTSVQSALPTLLPTTLTTPTALSLPQEDRVNKIAAGFDKLAARLDKTIEQQKDLITAVKDLKDSAPKVIGIGVLVGYLVQRDPAADLAALTDLILNSDVFDKFSGDVKGVNPSSEAVSNDQKGDLTSSKPDSGTAAGVTDAAKPSAK